jgi:hypothetical protein
MKTISFGVKLIVLAFAVVTLLGSTADGKNVYLSSEEPIAQGERTVFPNAQNCSHRAGNLWMTVTNWGFFGSQFQSDQLQELFCLGPGIVQGSLAPSAEFPAGSGINYLYQGALWIGAIVDGDTLVSVGADGWQHVNEMYPEARPNGGIVRRSIRPNDPHYDQSAFSDLDMIAEYCDTLTNPAWVGSDPTDNRPHLPLGLKIVQESYSWSQAAYEDFIVFRYRIKNIGTHYLSKVYFGLYYDCDVWNAFTPNGFADDISGSYRFQDPTKGDQVLVGWSADNDGDPNRARQWDAYSARGVIGVSLLGFPKQPWQSLNWWVSNGDASLDWGPRLRENDRNFGTGGLGTPEGDRNKYYIMSTPENDYDQLWSAVDQSAQGWLPPNAAIANNLADGYDTRFLFSFGAIDLAPGDSTEFAFVVAMGDNFHRNPDDFARFFNPSNPQEYYDSLDFSDLTTNILTARQLYRQLFVIIPGDADRSGQVDVADAIYLINYMFLGGPAPTPARVGDINGDCRLNIADIVYLISYLFRGGASPAVGCIEK